LVDYCRQLASTLSIHETCFTQTADSLFFVHDVLQQARAPIFDIPSALEVFLTGTAFLILLSAFVALSAI
jgi:mediator of RNA polymerase II transcription subunit 14